MITLLLIISGDVHPNPGPNSSDSSSVSSSDSSSVLSSMSDRLNTPNHLSVVQYNVQSLYHKIDLIQSELSSFDIISITETWLDANIPNSNILLPGFQFPERKDRQADHYGGVVIYVKDSIPFKRRTDLEINNVECIWIELKLCNSKTILFGLFYRPPNFSCDNTSRILDSIELAVDTGITNIIITGDFNLNTHTPASC